MSKAKRFVYRDRRTGRFVKKSTWSRSKAQGGSRYVRKTIGRKLHVRQLPPTSLRLATSPTVEFVLRAKSHDVKRTKEEPVEVHIEGPADATHQQVSDAVQAWAETGMSSSGFSPPKGIEWRGKVYDTGDPTLQHAIRNIFSNPETEVEKGNRDRGAGN